MRISACALLFSSLCLVSFPVALHSAPSFSLPDDCGQLVVGLADDWDSSRAVLQRWEKRDGVWVKVGSSWETRLGKNGLAWGLGLHPEKLEGLQKQEGDARAPAGVFELGEVYSYNESVRRDPSLPLRVVGTRDLWVEDVTSPYYNQHRLLDHEPRTEWEKKAQMRQNDPAHSLKLFVRHNALPDIRPGAGSSIFFHIWRQDGAKPSYGCTVMPEAQLREMIAWLEPGRHPLYVLLPVQVYGEKREAWKLP